MGKYLDTQRDRAKQVLKQVYRTDPVDDPLLDLICLNLQDDRGNTEPPPGEPEPTDYQMDRFIQAYQDRAHSFLPVVERWMSRENRPVPDDPQKMPLWAMSLVLNTLDEAGMYP